MQRNQYLTRLRFALSHLREHIFKHSFQTFCLCGLDVKTNTHFFLYCFLFSNQRCTLFSAVDNIDSSLINTNDTILAYILLFGKVRYINK